MKTLAVGTGADLVAQELFGGEIDHTPLLPGKKRTGYDALLSYMALCKVPRSKADETMRAWMEALNPGGEMVLFVPSLEWAAEQIFTQKRSPALMAHIYGTEKDPYMSGYTLLDVRSYCFRAGLAVTHASTGEYTINDFVCECHTVRGIKK